LFKRAAWGHADLAERAPVAQPASAITAADAKEMQVWQQRVMPWKITHPAPCRQSAGRRANLKRFPAKQQLLLPGTLLVTIQAQLLAALVLVDFRLAAFLD
jgi:hypothetical protein